MNSKVGSLSATLFFVFAWLLSRPIYAESCTSATVAALESSIAAQDGKQLGVQAKDVFAQIKQSPPEALNCAELLIPSLIGSGQESAAGFAESLYRKAQDYLHPFLRAEFTLERACDLVRGVRISSLMGDFRAVLTTHREAGEKLRSALYGRSPCYSAYVTEVISALGVDGDFKEARKLALQVLEDTNASEDERVAVEVSLGTALLAKSQYAEAYGAFEDATQRSPHSPISAIAHYWLALRAQNEGRESEYHERLAKAKSALTGNEAGWARHLADKISLVQGKSGEVEQSATLPVVGNATAKTRLKRDYEIAIQKNAK